MLLEVVVLLLQTTVLLFEMVLGFRPFAASSKEDLLAEAIVRNQPQWPSNVPRKLQTLLENLLCSDPKVC